MRAKTIKPNTFQDFYDSAPAEIKDYINRCADTPQSALWHPEGNAKIHINIVFNRAKRTGDINLMLSAFFHDLGKADATKYINGKWSAHGHEFASLRLVEKYKAWIEKLGADYDIVHYVVKNHMRAKQIHQMRRAKREAFMSDEYYPLVAEFSKFDDMQTDYSNDIDD